MEKPKYRFLRASFVDGMLIEAGTVAVVQGRHVPAEHWQPINEPARAACAKAKVAVSREMGDEDTGKMVDTTSPPPPPPQVAALLEPGGNGEGGDHEHDLAD